MNDRFNERYVAFVDILGFRNIVKHMATDERLFVTIREALTGLGKQSDIFREYARTRTDKKTVATKPSPNDSVLRRLCTIR